jgi:hypothetical protein
VCELDVNTSSPPKIITFDQDGISGHINHRAVSAGVRYGVICCLYHVFLARLPVGVWLRVTHTALFGCRKYVSEGSDHPPAYAVQTKILPRTYSFLLPILEALLFRPPAGEDTEVAEDRYGDKGLLVSNWKSYLQTRAACRQHKSKWAWDTALYQVMNPYMWLNDLRKMGVQRNFSAHEDL